MKRNPRGNTLLKLKVSHTPGGKFTLWNRYNVYWYWNFSI